MPLRASRPVRVAIIGAGPSGFYAAGALAEKTRPSFAIDIFDRLPAPFGLVRNGVAPDHEKIKSVERIYDRIAALPNVRFYGNVALGEHLSVEDFRRYFDMIIYAVGTPADRKLDVPGEELERSYSATAFVGWYNGHPDFRDCTFDLSVERVAVVGNGNVAMDVARILLRDPDTLARTDIADHALAALRQSRVRDVTMLGRRGPAQAAFTNPELREIGSLLHTDIVLRGEELDLDPASEASLEINRDARRNVETLQKFLDREPAGRRKRLHMRFLVSPVEILGRDGHVRGVRLMRNRLEPTGSGYIRPVATGEEETIEVGALFRAIGYRGIRIPGVPYHTRWSTIPNRFGRVLESDEGDPILGQYVVGWAKRGPTGVIGTNKPDAIETVEAMLEDLERGDVLPTREPDPAAFERFLRERQPALVTYDDWLLIDAVERERGEREGRPRVKFCTVEEMLDALERARDAA